MLCKKTNELNESEYVGSRAGNEHIEDMNVVNRLKYECETITTKNAECSPVTEAVNCYNFVTYIYFNLFNRIEFHVCCTGAHSTAHRLIFIPFEFDLHFMPNELNEE